MERIFNFLTSLDIYGHPVGVLFKGSSVYQTRLGALITLITYMLMLFNLQTLFSAFLDGSKQEEKVSITYTDSFLTDAYNLKENNLEIQALVFGNSSRYYGVFKFYHAENYTLRPLEAKLCTEIEER